METLARTDLNLIRVGFLILGVRFVVGGGGRITHSLKLVRIILET